MSTNSANAAKPRTRWQRFRASDIFYSFKRSPMTVVASIVTLSVAV